MDKQHQRLVNFLLLLSDIAIWLFSIAAAYHLRFGPFGGDIRGALSLGYYLRLSPVLIVIYLLLYQINGLYDAFRRQPLVSVLGKLTVSNAIGFFCVLMLLFWFRLVNVSRFTLVLFAVVSTALSGLLRIAVRKAIRALRRRGYNVRRLLLVGCNDIANRFYRRVASNKSYGYIIDGYLNGAPSPLGWEAEYLGPIENLTAVLTSRRVDEVMISLDFEQFDRLSDIIDICEMNGVKSSLLPFYNKYLPSKPQIEIIEDIPIINLRHIPLDNIVYAAIKRAIDVLGSFFGLILISPLLAATAIAIKLTSPGPVIYKQVRIGRNRKVFTMYKFRSMRVADNADATTWGTEQDPRRTKFGAFLRKFSIDELPQLVNVLKGDMSLVGPRPERPFFVEKFRDEVPLYMLKHLVRPGITGWAQINGWRGDTSILERIKCDMYYIENWSLLLDIKILWLTVFKGIVNPSEKL